ncbi:hypothetical protein [Streptomyces sp. WG-D5]
MGEAVDRGDVIRLQFGGLADGAARDQMSYCPRDKSLQSFDRSG